MPYNTTKWTEKLNPSWHAQFGLVGAAAMRDLYVIQGPNVTCDVHGKIAFFAFHAFVVEDSRFQQNQVRTKRYNGGACVCKSNVEITIAGFFCCPQQNDIIWFEMPNFIFLMGRSVAHIILVFRFVTCALIGTLGEYWRPRYISSNLIQNWN